ncbi:hypothetical protein BHM03_00043172 [Ensete ventricosum]|nr:hypothetical protein BHM03_00043172 [Ensete ventricosum]
MADALAQMTLLAPHGHRSLSHSSHRRNRLVCASKDDPLRSSSSLNSQFHGRRLVIGAQRERPLSGNRGSSFMTLCFKKAPKWWEKGLHPNMKKIKSAEDLVDSLSNAGDELVVVDFFSPGCAGCRALHPKICQLAELNPDVQFLQVNHEEHKSMCYTLNVHVLPFFRFYRGAHGRLCSFSCTNATVRSISYRFHVEHNPITCSESLFPALHKQIKKFKDALAKHITERCSLGPAKGLEETELLALAVNKDLSFTYAGTPVPVPDAVAEKAPFNPNLPVHAAARLTLGSEDKAFAAAGR